MKRIFLILGLCLGLLVSVSYGKDDEGKIPITTSSEKALKSYLQGRDLSEKLRATDSRKFFQNAVAEDPNFAIGYSNLAATEPTASGFFEQLNKAVALADKASEGEKLWILGVEAGTNGDPKKQNELYQKLVKLFPEDERAYNLLGGNYFGQQDYANAIVQYEKAVKIAPEFSQPYNQLGYSHRFMGNFKEAEKAFKKYIDLIPDDPNPYDSYAELLLKMGKYDESISNYQKALAIDPNFIASHVGIAVNQIYKDNHQAAREQLQKLHNVARNDAEHRAALFTAAVSYADEGKMDVAIAEIKKQYAIAEKTNDVPAMSGDVFTTANILLERGKLDEALASYQKSLRMTEESNLSKEIKTNAARGFLFNEAQVALEKKDLALAKSKAAEYKKQVESLNNPFQIRLSHQIAGMIALEEKAFDTAISELQQSNQQDPYNIYRIAQAYAGKGNNAKAKEMYAAAANFNALNNMNQAFIRNKAKQMVGTK